MQKYGFFEKEKQITSKSDTGSKVEYTKTMSYIDWRNSANWFRNLGKRNSH